MKSENGGRVKMSNCVKNSQQPKAQQAQWNVQVVRGKVTTRCLWNACKALSIGLLLLTIGTTMAVIGYYADQLSIRSETRGNSTVKIRNESRGFHLNNLSYAGPIIMGVGGFIVVAACVMTFEARDSAAKVVPARFKANMNASVIGGSTKTTPRAPRSFQRMESKRSASVQTPGGGKSCGSEKMENIETGSEWSPRNDPAGRKAFTAAFVQFSRELMENSDLEGNRRWRRRTREANLNKSPSAPNLAGDDSASAAPLGQEGATKAGRTSAKGSLGVENRLLRESVRPLETVSRNLILRLNYLQREALSMDNPFFDSYDCCTPPTMRLSRQHSRRSAESRDSFEMDLGSSAGVSGSQTSMALDLHDCQVTLKVKDESATKRSDTARRHQLLRQKPVEEHSHPDLPSTSLRSPCHHCRMPMTSPCEKTHISKITSAFRSQSFSHACPHCDPPRVFCIDDHRRSDHSAESIRLSCEERLRCMRRHSPCASPFRSPGRQVSKSAPLNRGAKDLRNNKKKPKYRMEASLSAEEQHTARTGMTGKHRSGSFSPTGHPTPPGIEETEINAPGSPP